MENDLQNLDEYLAGRLEGKALQDFLDRVAEDQELAEVLAFRQSLQEEATVLGQEDLLQRLKNIHQKVTGEQGPSMTSNRRWWWLLLLVIASLAALLGYFLFPKSEPEELYKKYYEPYPIALNTRDQNNEALLARIEALYYQKQYGEVLDLLRDVPSPTSQILLLEGICHLELQQWPLAKQSFYALQGKNDPLFNDQASWYLALAHLQTTQFDSVQHYLQQLNIPTQDHFLEAQQLKKEIN